MWDWQCNIFIYSCYLYEVENNPVLSDALFDEHCNFLFRWYHELPEWFTSRVPRDQLEAGTSLGLTYSDEEISQARIWRHRIRKLKKEYGRE